MWEAVNIIAQAFKCLALYAKTGVGTILLDSSCDRFYLKETDASGFSKITTYDFKEVKEEPEQDKYLTKAEFEELMKKYELNFKQSTMEQSTTKPTVQTKF